MKATKIADAKVWAEDFELIRPYTIAFRTVTSVPNMIVQLKDNEGRIGLGSASPEPFVTGENFAACKTALESFDFSQLDENSLGQTKSPLETFRTLVNTPAARAAIDIALWDLKAQASGQPLVTHLGQHHDSLATSITIGIKPVAEVLEEAREYEERGFKIIKLKLGHDLEEDIERTAKLRETVGSRLKIRVDLNQGYNTDSLQKYLEKCASYDIEFCEQPLPVKDFAQMVGLPDEVRQAVAADEALLKPEHALEFAEKDLCGIFNIKLMKCGGITPALEIAKTAHTHSIDLMWGCMDESRISISAALHAAYSCPSTKYIDLDGHLDLDRDIADAGFTLDNGIMRPRLDRNGHGAQRT